MKYNFDEIIDRKKSKCRKWDNKILKEKFGLNEDAIPMDLADLDFKCAPEIVSALTERAALGDYGYTYAYDEYYDAIIDWNKRRYNIELEKEWITLTFGTVSTLHYIVQALLNEGESAMINTPAYDPFRDAIVRQNCNLVCSPLKIVDNKYYFDFEDMKRRIKTENVKLFILCSPQNPSGRVWTKEELNKICELCIENNVILVSDEIHRDIVFKKGSFTTLWNSNNEIINNSIMCISPNKGFNLGGLKSSYIVIKNKEIRDRVKRQLEQNSITSPHVFAIPALIAAYNDSEMWLDELTEYIEGNFEIFYSFMKEVMPKAKVMKADSAFLAWIDVREIFKNEDEAREFFTKANISIVYGSYFVKDGDGFIRINLGCQREVLKKALERIKETLKDYN